MPRFNRIASVNNRHTTLFQSKSKFSRLNGDTGESITFFAEETPLPICEPIDYDCNWFLAVGGRKATVSGCQLGDSYQIPRNDEVLQFPGEVTYKLRPGVSSREGLTLYTDPKYRTPAPLDFISTSYLVTNQLSESGSVSYLEIAQLPIIPPSVTYLDV